MLGGMSEQDPWLLQYGDRRGAATPRWLVVLLTLAAVALALAAVSLVRAVRDHPWKPPSGLGGFRTCTHGGRLDTRCFGIPVPNGITLHVEVVPATRQPAEGALFYLEGGPRGAASATAVKVSEVFATVSEHRDIVLVDQRGTGGSHPVDCPQEHVPATSTVQVAAYVRRCFAQVGAEARFLTTAAAADDIERVRRALGYGRIDVYGSSYGATLAQEYLRRHGGSVRTATLDGASLPGAHVYELAARNAGRALRLVLARCGAGPGCRRAFPDPAADLALVLSAHPGSADALATTIAALLRKPEDAARVPLLIHQAATGDVAPLAREHALHEGRELDARARLAMVWTILCNEGWARFGVAATEEAATGSFLARASAARARLFRRACAGVPPAASAEGRWRSAVPVLLLAGSADPLDPPASAVGWRSVFPNGRLVTAPGLAHGVVAYGCLRLVVARFIAAGSARGLDGGCALRVPLPPFELS
jgi:pimeloyl-ACP methyl ester carboxylesterase